MANVRGVIANHDVDAKIGFGHIIDVDWELWSILEENRKIKRSNDADDPILPKVQGSITCK